MKPKVWNKSLKPTPSAWRCHCIYCNASSCIWQVVNHRKRPPVWLSSVSHTMSLQFVAFIRRLCQMPAAMQLHRKHEHSPLCASGLSKTKWFSFKPKFYLKYLVTTALHYDHLVWKVLTGSWFQTKVLNFGFSKRKWSNGTCAWGMMYELCLNEILCRLGCK